MHQLYAIVTWREIVGEQYELQSFPQAGEGITLKAIKIGAKKM